MPRERTRRAVIAAALGGGLVGATASPLREYLDGFAPFSGSVWEGLRRRVEGTVESPYGPGTVRYDDYGVPHIEAESEPALYFAVGYVHAGDRLFQMDLQRRQLRGELSEVAGEATVDSDEFHRRMDFAGAARANVEGLDGTDTQSVVEAYVDGVNACIENEPLPMEFGLLGYEPDEWTVVDVMLMEKSISWALTGQFRVLQIANAREALGDSVTAELFPDHLDHDAPIIRDREREGAANVRPRTASQASQPADPEAADRNRSYDALAGWLSEFERPPGIGSNSWVVSGEHTASGDPLLANDPHLQLQAPPVWYEQHLETPDYSVRGGAFPGQPFVVIGRNHTGAWGVTNVHSDIVDCYEYETDGEQYRYDGEWRAFESREETIDVADGENRSITARKTVHGPYLEREGQDVGVAWTGLTGTETVRAIHEYARHDDFDEFLDATRKFDLPTQSLVYANREGRTLYYVTGRFPIRRIDGEVVDGNRIFDGSAAEGEWEGFEPYGQSSWEGFVPFEEKPGLIDPDYLGTANQTITHESGHYIGPDNASPFRGKRLYDLLDSGAQNGRMDAADMARLQLDVYDTRADTFMTDALAVRERCSDAGQAVLDTLEDWDGEMSRDSRGALAFDILADQYREIAFEEPLSDAGVERSPLEWTVLTLEGDAAWFDREGVPDRIDAIVEAVEATARERSEIDAETYGEYNLLSIPHPFGVDFLGYEGIVMDGAGTTLKNVRRAGPHGTSLRVIVPFSDEEARVILPGGNDGRYGSPNYDDQLRPWADGEYRSMPLETTGDLRLEFTEERDD